MPVLSCEQIKNHLPHRYPFLLVDRVLDYKERDFLIALKNITVNEPCFTGHFPETPIYPGVLITETMAQAAALLGEISMVEKPDEAALYFLVGIDKIRFKRPVVPGDQLIVEAKFIKVKRNIWCFEAVAKVDANIVATGQLLTTISVNGS